MSEKRETDDRLGPLLEYFAERLNRVFAHFLCVLEFRDDEDAKGDPVKNDRTWTLMTIQNACLHESLIAIRDLDDFLAGRDSKTRADDLTSSDFGDKIRRSFLSRSERKAISKLIAHTTTGGASSQGVRWDVWELLTITGEKPDADFAECYPPDLIRHAVEFSFKGFAEIGCLVMPQTGMGKSQALLNEAWRRFRADPDTYPGWENIAMNDYFAAFRL
jgi:hypothetical protein